MVVCLKLIHIISALRFSLSSKIHVKPVSQMHLPSVCYNFNINLMKMMMCVLPASNKGHQVWALLF